MVHRVARPNRCDPLRGRWCIAWHVLIAATRYGVGGAPHGMQLIGATRYGVGGAPRGTR